MMRKLSYVVAGIMFVPVVAAAALASVALYVVDEFRNPDRE